MVAPCNGVHGRSATLCPPEHAACMCNAHARPAHAGTAVTKTVVCKCAVTPAGTVRHVTLCCNRGNREVVGRVGGSGGAHDFQGPRQAEVGDLEDRHAAVVPEDEHVGGVDVAEVDAEQVRKLQRQHELLDDEAGSRHRQALGAGAAGQAVDIAAVRILERDAQEVRGADERLGLDDVRVVQRAAQAAVADITLLVGRFHNCSAQQERSDAGGIRKERYDIQKVNSPNSHATWLKTSGRGAAQQCGPYCLHRARRGASCEGAVGLTCDDRSTFKSNSVQNHGWDSSCW